MPREVKLSELASPRELVVVTRPGAEMIVSDGTAVSDTFDTTALNRLLEEPEIRLKPLLGLSERRLKIKARAVEAETGVTPPDLSTLYRLHAPDRRLEELVARVAEAEVVEAAYIKPGVVPAVWHTDTAADPTLPPETKSNLEKFQRYLSPAQAGGIDVRFAHERKAFSEKVRIIDVEGAWNFGHDDLKENHGGVVGGICTTLPLWRQHGTATIGVFSGDNNGRGILGICPEAQVMGVSVFNPGVNDWGTAAAINAAADKLSEGDILLIEVQRAGSVVNFDLNEDQIGCVPLEWWYDDWKAIKAATTRGILVVTAGANGRQRLDDPVYDKPIKSPHGSFPSDWENPFRRKAMDSGSIIVGAGAPPKLTSLPDRARLAFSNYGDCFDAQGWGDLVATCGGGDLEGGGGPDENFWYTGRFSGTSSAAAMVAGALACLQGALKKAGKPVLTPPRARQVLRASEQKQTNDPKSPDTNRIGSRPDLKQMIEKFLPVP